ncbi:MAG: glycosyltransferase [Bacteroidia bacterium]|nr:glycosyltransferase [Bacteroidia bacterium]
MAKKILIISQTPTHPQNAGNRARIFNMAEYIISLGHDVWMLHAKEQDCNIEAVREYWNGKYYEVPYKRPKTVRKEISRIKRLLNLDKNEKYYIEIDDDFNPNLHNILPQIVKEHHFDIVLVEYIFLTKALEYFDDTTLKIVDTHDIMANRHKLFQKQGKEPSWYSVKPSEEKKGVNRADVVIAIQQHEKKYFQKISSRKVVSVGHLVTTIDVEPKELPRKKILFIGSDNPINLHGLEYFLTECWPEILRSLPDMEFIIAGNICNKIGVHNGVKKIGAVDDIASAYEMSDIVINPLILGTGLKIKMIEALGRSKIVLSSNIGAEGLEKGINNAFLLANSPADYVSVLNKLFGVSSLGKKLSKGAYEFAKQCNEANAKELAELFK